MDRRSEADLNWEKEWREEGKLQPHDTHPLLALWLKDQILQLKQQEEIEFETEKAEQVGEAMERGRIRARLTDAEAELEFEVRKAEAIGAAMEKGRIRARMELGADLVTPEELAEAEERGRLRARQEFLDARRKKNEKK